MNQALFGWLTRELRSAADRTDIRVSHDGVCVDLHRRRSPYATHREINFMPAVPSRALWVQTRDQWEGFALYHSSDPQPGQEEVESWLDTEVDACVADLVHVPAALFEPLLNHLNGEVGGWLPHCPTHGLVWVVCVRRRRVDWDENGKPVFADRVVGTCVPKV